MHAHGHHPRLQTAPTAVCHFNYPRRIFSLITFPTQTKSLIPDLHSEKDPLKTKLATRTHIVASMKTLIPGRPFQWAPSARILTGKPVPPRPKQRRDATPRHQPPFCPASQSPVSVRGLHEVRTLRLPNARRRNLSHSLSYLLTMSHSTRVTMKMKRVSHDTATVTRSASVRWLLAIMMPARVNGSICRVSV